MSLLKYDAFISYSHADCGNIAPGIQRGIENIGKPWYKMGRRLNIFRDETNLTASPELWPSIEKALSNSDNFILFASPVAACSGWVNDEVRVWTIKNWTSEKGIDKIYIILTAGEIEWDKAKRDFNWEKTNSLPKEVLSEKFKNEPLWIDLRPYVRNNTTNEKIVDYKSAGFVMAMTRIIGSLTGKSPRDIESDELKRTRGIKRFLVVTFLVLFSLLVLSVILYNDSLAQKREAIRQKKEAITQKDTAERNLKDFQMEKLSRNIRNGNIYLEASEFCLASEAYRSADSIVQKYPDEMLVKENKTQLKIKLDSCTRLCRQ